MSADLVARRVTRVFRGGAGVHEMDLHVRPGEIHALVGLNGAGKSTLMKLLLGMLRPTAGVVSLGGIPLRNLPGSAWAGVGHVVEHPFAYGDLTVRENLLLSARLRGLNSVRAGAAVAGAVEELGLELYADVLARRLSTGNRQRVALAAALQHRPCVAVLDEPSSALDPAGVLLLRDCLRRHAAAGSAILVSSHHLDEVARIADRITVVNAGRIIGELDPAATDLERVFFDRVLADDRQREAR